MPLVARLSELCLSPLGSHDVLVVVHPEIWESLPLRGPVDLGSERHHFVPVGLEADWGSSQAKLFFDFFLSRLMAHQGDTGKIWVLSARGPGLGSDVGAP